MRYLLTTLVVSIALFGLSTTDLFRDPATVAANTRILNARAEQIEMKNEFQAQLNAIEIHQRENQQKEADAAVIDQREWSKARLNIVSNAFDFGLKFGAVIGVLIVLAYLYKTCIAPSLQSYWWAKARESNRATQVQRRSSTPPLLLPPMNRSRTPSILDRNNNGSSNIQYITREETENPEIISSRIHR